MHSSYLQLLYALALVTCGWFSTAHAHPFHISLAEMEWNTESKRAEVSLKLHAVDFERALSALAGQKIRLEDEAFPRWATRYLSQHFFLTHAIPVDPSSPSGSGASSEVTELARRSKLHFVGHELDDNWLWLYFELSFQPPHEKLSLVNTVLFDVLSDQINTLTVRHNRRKYAVRTNRGAPMCTLQAEWFDPTNP